MKYKSAYLILVVGSVLLLSGCSGGGGGGSGGGNGGGGGGASPGPIPTTTVSPTPGPTGSPTPVPVPTLVPVNINPNRVVAELIASSANSGLSYVGTNAALTGLTLPVSYYSTPAYFGAYVCNLSGNNCSVTDVYNGTNYTVVPTSIESGADLQYERVDVANGTDIYDAATWQIALAVATKNGVSNASYALAQNQNLVLTLGYDGKSLPAAGSTQNANRANTASFTYSPQFNILGTSINQANNAYFFRMITQNWLSADPFQNTAYGTLYITTQGFPGAPYAAGLITWADWKPITGENVWAFFLGPLQTEYLAEGPNPNYVNYYNSVAVQNAINVLFTINLMQSPIGALYYAPKGSLGNTGSALVNPYTVSIENNASGLAGLLVLYNTLKNIKNHAPAGTVDPTVYANLQAMIFGGTTTFTISGAPVIKTTSGVMSFLQNYAFDKTNGIFYQEGHANDPAYPGQVWAPGVDANGSLKTVDVNTWTISLLAQVIDSWNLTDSSGKPVTSYSIWQNVKSFGGFTGPDNTLWGVGYSAADGNGYSPSNPTWNQSGILSAEWTAGAINMVSVLRNLYSSDNAKLASLSTDYNSMVKGVMSLSTDNYNGNGIESAYSFAPFPHAPSNYLTLVPQPPATQLGFLYASKRYFIPFGWFANPLPSTCATAWMIMVHYGYNPFILGGGVAPASYFSQ